MGLALFAIGGAITIVLAGASEGSGKVAGDLMALLAITLELAISLSLEGINEIGCSRIYDGLFHLVWNCPHTDDADISSRYYASDSTRPY